MSREMGMELKGAGGVERFNDTSWRKVLQLAQEHGWRPAGTQAPSFTLDDGTVQTEEDWSGTYLSNNYQRVADEDAANIAKALQRALDDISDLDTGGEKWVTLPPSNPYERMMAARGFEMSGPNPALTPVEYSAAKTSSTSRTSSDSAGPEGSLSGRGLIVLAEEFEGVIMSRGDPPGEEGKEVTRGERCYYGIRSPLSVIPGLKESPGSGRASLKLSWRAFQCTKPVRCQLRGHALPTP